MTHPSIAAPPPGRRRPGPLFTALASMLWSFQEVGLDGWAPMDTRLGDSVIAWALPLP